MIMYVLIGLSFVLVGIVGLQFTYLFYVDWLDLHRKKYIRSLELRCAQLSERLDAAEERIADQKERLAAVYMASENENEVWADVIGER